MRQRVATLVGLASFMAVIVRRQFGTSIYAHIDRLLLVFATPQDRACAASIGLLKHDLDMWLEHPLPLAERLLPLWDALEGSDQIDDARLSRLLIPAEHVGCCDESAATTDAGS